MDAWIPISIAAALAQTIRFMVQKTLASGALSPAGATWARFLYSAPIVGAVILAYAQINQASFPEFSVRFWIFALSGGLMQILATICTVALFSHRAFAVGITFKKTEVMLTALAGFVILGEVVSVWGGVAILIGFLGVLALSDPPEGGGVFNRAAGLGLLSGIFFALSAVGYRGATLELATDDVFLKAGVTLALVTATQAAALGMWLYWREPEQITATIKAWRVAGLVGVFSLIGSWCWFAAFSLQNAAYVFALGQIELIFSLIVGALIFHETIQRRELAGMGLLTLSILVLVAGI